MSELDEVDRRAEMFRRENAQIQEQERLRQSRIDSRSVELAKARPRFIEAVARTVSAATNYSVMVVDDHLICFVDAAGTPARLDLICALVEPTAKIDSEDWALLFSYEQYLPIEGKAGFYEVGSFGFNGRHEFSEGVQRAADASLDCLAFAVAEGLSLLPAANLSRYANPPSRTSIPLPAVAQ